jgi:hypothetical protein
MIIADAIIARACVPDEQSFARLVHHLHLVFAQGNTVLARAVLDERCLRLFRRNGYAVIEARDAGGLAVSIELPQAITCDAVAADVVVAAAVRLFAVDRDTIQIELHDEQHFAPAIARLDVDAFANFITHTLDIFELANAGGLMSQPCQSEQQPVAA